MPAPICSERVWASTWMIASTHPLTAKRKQGVEISNTGSSVAPAIALDSIGGLRNCLKLEVSDSGGACIVDIPIAYVQNGIAANSPLTSFDRSWGLWRFDLTAAMNWAGSASGNVCFAAILDGSKNELARWHNVDGKMRTTISSTAAQVTEGTQSVIQDTYGNITLTYQPSTNGSSNDGSIGVLVNDVVRTGAAQTHSVATSIGYLRLCCIKYSTGAATNIVRILRDSICDGRDYTEMAFAQADLRYNDGTYRELAECRKVGSAYDVSMRVGIQPGVYKAAWEGVADLVCKIKYHAGAVWNAGSAIDGEVLALPTSLDFCRGGKGISQIAPGQYVAKRFYYRTSAPGDVFEAADVFAFTVDDVTQARKWRNAFAHCRDQERARPYRSERYRRQAALDETTFLGDDGYQDAGGGGILRSDTCPNIDGVWWVRDHTGQWEDKFQREYGLVGFRKNLFDDHDWMFNDSRAAMKRGYVSAANPTGLDGTAYRSHAIVALNTTGGAGADTISIAGDHRTYFTAGLKIKVAGHSVGGINASWTIASRLFTGGNTVLTLSENLPSSSAAEGTVNLICDEPTLQANNVAVKDLVDGLRPAYKALYLDTRLDRQSGGTGDFDAEQWGWWESHSTLWCSLDTRAFQDSEGVQPTSDGVATMLGTVQRDAFLSLFATTTKRVVVIDSPAAVSTRVGGSDNWVDVAPAELISLMQVLQNNPNVRLVIWRCGDRHYTMIDRPFGSLGFEWTKLGLACQVGPSGTGTMPAYQVAWETNPNVAFSSINGLTEEQNAQAAVTRMDGITEIDEVAGTHSVRVYDGMTNAELFELTESWSGSGTARPVRPMLVMNPDDIDELDANGIAIVRRN